MTNAKSLPAAPAIVLFGLDGQDRPLAATFAADQTSLALKAATSLKLQTLKSTDAMAQAMKGVTRAMMAMNKQVHNICFSACLPACAYLLSAASLLQMFQRWHNSADGMCAGH